MKIASFNINNINRRLANLLSWLREAGPDIVCLQELKAADSEVPAEVHRHDIHPTKSWDRNAPLQAAEPCRAYQRLLAQGWTDAVRALHPKEPMYTFWDTCGSAGNARDLGIDRVLISPVLKQRLQGAGVDRHIRGQRTPATMRPCG